MSLNWKEIDLILSELDLPGSQIQRAVQTTFDVLALRVHGKGKSRDLLISLSPGACRFHETFRGIPKPDKPLRFMEFLNSRIVNGWIEEAVQLGDNRIIRLRVRLGVYQYRIYLRLWSNAANVVVTGEDGAILDAMRRLPKRGETSGGHYAPEEAFKERLRGEQDYAVREFPPDFLARMPPHTATGAATFNEKIDAWYAEHGSALSLDTLGEQARKTFEGRIGRLQASLERLRVKEGDYAAADRFREYGDLILTHGTTVKRGDPWLEAKHFDTDEIIRIKLDPRKSPSAQAESYYEQYRKAKKGIAELRAEIEAGEQELIRLETALRDLLTEKNPFRLHKLLKNGGIKTSFPPGRGAQLHAMDQKRPGLSFRCGEWLIIVGRDAGENDLLLRYHVKGKDLWLHARDYPGSYVFIKQRPGKTVPLEILLDAGNLAIFYSKGRNNGEGDLFYTPVKFLRRVKDGPKGLVIPSQEKNLHIKVDEKRLKALETCRIEKSDHP